MSKIYELHRRSFLKALRWRILATCTTMIISFFVTGNIKYALSIGMFEVTIKIFLYYFHERAWTIISRGRGLIESRQQTNI